MLNDKNVIRTQEHLRCGRFGLTFRQIKRKFIPLFGRGIQQRKISDLLFEIKIAQNAKARIAHHDRLKLYCGKFVPDWFLKDKIIRQRSTEPVKNKQTNEQDKFRLENAAYFSQYGQW